MDSRLEKIRRLNYWDDNRLNSGVDRPFYTRRIEGFLPSRVVKVLVGQRRTGKSFVLRQIISHLLNKGVSERNILYVNLEFLEFGFLETGADLYALIQAFVKEMNPQGTIYLFLDEIHNLKGWEKVVNSLSQDPATDFNVFLTGSNSKMLSSELSTWLSGRYVEFQIFPFSFSEYLSVQPTMRASGDTLAQYLNSGGLPEFINLNDEETRRNYVDSVKNTVILRDIVGRYNIKDISLMERLFAYAVNNTTSLLSYKNIVNYLKSNGVSSNYDTVATYLDYLCQSFLLHKCERYNIKGKETLNGTAKFYANDPAYHNYLYSGYGFGNGYLLENYVYLSLRRFGYNCYVGQWAGKEVDFVALKSDKCIYVQVAYMIDSLQTWEREYTPLQQLKDGYPRWIVTMDAIHNKAVDGIEHIQAWNLEARLLLLETT